MTAAEAIAQTIESLGHYGQHHEHWAIAWSGGKDSTALLTLIVHLIAAGRVKAPKRLTICYADTRMELPPLAISAASIIEQLRNRGHDVRVVMAPLDKRFFVYMLGRGVPPPNNNTFRWCTRQIKVEPMYQELRRIVAEAGQKVLMLTGVRQGESAARDRRIALSCTRDGGECGQGWYQETLPGSLCDTLAPILHWRLCLVWDWLMGIVEEHGFATKGIAEAYGIDEEGSDAEVNARTGCVGCPLANRDTALEAVIKFPHWAYIAPLRGLRPIYRELRLPENRLRKPGGETREDGSLVANQHRMGPLTMEARLRALNQILSIQSQINHQAELIDRPGIDILNAQEVTRIYELIGDNTWPNKWTGDEPTADEPFEEDGDTKLLYGLLDSNGGAK